MSQRAIGLPNTSQGFHLEFPQTLAVFDKYEDAQKAVDYLADNMFPVQNLAIVGTDLKQYERVMGRKTWGTVLAQGALSGVMNGILIGFLMYFMNRGTSITLSLLLGVVLGVIFGAIFAVIANSLGNRNRDFNSVTAIFANKYEVLCEHRVVGQAREKLMDMPGYRAIIFAGNAQTSGYGQPYAAPTYGDPNNPAVGGYVNPYPTQQTPSYGQPPVYGAHPQQPPSDQPPPNNGS